MMSIARDYLALLEEYEGLSEETNEQQRKEPVNEKLFGKKDKPQSLSDKKSKLLQHLQAASAPTMMEPEPSHIGHAPASPSFRDYKRMLYRTRPGLDRSEPLVDPMEMIGTPSNIVGYPGSGVIQQGATTMRGTGRVPAERGLVPTGRRTGDTFVQGTPWTTPRGVLGAPQPEPDTTMPPPSGQRATSGQGAGFTFRSSTATMGTPPGGSVPPTSGASSGGFVPPTTGPKPGYSFAHLGGTAPHGTTASDLGADYLDSLKHVGRFAGKVALGTARGIGIGAKKGAGIVAYPIRKAWDAHKEMKKTREMMGPSAPDYIVREVVALKKQFAGYGDFAKDFIDALAKEKEEEVRDLAKENMRDFKLQKKLIQQRYHRVGKVLARQQGRKAAWDVVASVPRVAWQAYSDEKARIAQEAQHIRDLQSRAREGQIQLYKQKEQQWREQYLGYIKSRVKQFISARTGHVFAESLGLSEGKARDFQELMRNKRKVRDRHIRAIHRRTMKLAKTPAEKKLEKYLTSMPGIPRRVGLGKATPKQWKARRSHALQRKIEAEERFTSRYPWEVRRARALRRRRAAEERFITGGYPYYEKHPVSHYAGKIIAAPVTVPYRLGRGVARFTGINQLPGAMKDVHAEMKHQFIHGFLLR
jgi:hypothetical protein